MKKIFYPLLFSGSLVISYFIIQAYNNGNMVLVKQLLIGWISPFLILGVLPTKRGKHTLSKFRHEEGRFFLR
ncbi:hypothetical protein [Psychrobacillus sp. MER TA 171]|uniref:hypothetical protein n=1 Tax=Psychrobacillus sp. MER TA 171 TaxID=2939577 RepID=UPI002041681C|nr:hypothetical protein [Psychrobacillus sp. MER TA 171]MCM3358094.1 hypothetical protein [Psychrobacillus sp. MER TA 171]